MSGGELKIMSSRKKAARRNILHDELDRHPNVLITFPQHPNQMVLISPARTNFNDTRKINVSIFLEIETSNLPQLKAMDQGGI